MKYPYSEQELYDNYEFKVVKKAIMKEFPWITNVSVNPQDLDRYNFIYLNFDVDPIKFSEEYDVELASWVRRAWEEGKEYNATLLSLIGEDFSYEDSKEITDKIMDLIREVHNSPALPHDLKVKGNRHFHLGDFTINRGKESWF